MLSFYNGFHVLRTKGWPRRTEMRKARGGLLQHSHCAGRRWIQTSVHSMPAKGEEKQGLKLAGEGCRQEGRLCGWNPQKKDVCYCYETVWGSGKLPVECRVMHVWSEECVHSRSISRRKSSLLVNATHTAQMLSDSYVKALQRVNLTKMSNNDNQFCQIGHLTWVNKKDTDVSQKTIF